MLKEGDRTGTIDTEEEALRVHGELFFAEAALLCQKIASGASGRQFYRMTSPSGKIILMSYPGDKEENLLYAALGRWLRGENIAVPEILQEDTERRLLWLEDVGELNLLGYCQERSRKVPEKDPFEQAISLLVKLQRLPEQPFPKQQIRTLPAFDRELYTFEQNYFREELLGRLPDIEPIPFAALKELQSLPDTLLEGPCSWVHRDFQSQNLILDKSDRVHVVDFQGMRRGSSYYDLASVLYDPYTSLQPHRRQELASLYCLESGRPEDELRHYLPLAALQRLMQALGAYGKLGLGLGIPFFQQHIVPGFSQLNQACHECSMVPEFTQWLERNKPQINIRGRTLSNCK